MDQSMKGRYLLIRGDAGRIALPDKSVDLVLGSPPYADARLYLEDGRDLSIARGCREWVKWMLDITAEALRVCKGPVIWVAAGVTRDRCYWPACEGLMWEWWQRGGECQLYRPCAWVKTDPKTDGGNGIPGSGGSDWFRSDWEYCMCFKRPGPLPWSDNRAMGHLPKWGPGGEMSNRRGNGMRRNHTKRKNDGMMENQTYKPPDISNPGNVIRARVGGGHMGSWDAHDGEAPFPEQIVEWFVRSLCPPGGRCLDPFSGSGTTASVAVRHNRRAIGADLRQSQCLLGRRRIAEQLIDEERPHRPKVGRKAGMQTQPDAETPLFQGL
jgi:hypothetical protein